MFMTNPQPSVRARLAMRTSKSDPKAQAKILDSYGKVPLS
jgi:hypothetical protein